MIEEDGPVAIRYDAPLDKPLEVCRYHHHHHLTALLPPPPRAPPLRARYIMCHSLCRYHHHHHRYVATITTTRASIEDYIGAFMCHSQNGGLQLI